MIIPPLRDRLDDIPDELANGGTIFLQDQSALFTQNNPSSLATPIAAATGTLKQAVEEFETQVIDRVLRESRFNKTEAARKLGISVNTLWRRLKE